MAERKQRTRQQIMEDESLRILKNSLPEEWVLREHNPDYGIDLSLEIFKYTSQDKRISQTQGEHIYIQLKSVESIDIKKYKIYNRKNIERIPFKKLDDFIEINVLKYQIDVSLLLTIKSMGSAIPFMLFVVDLETSEIYYICLTDYIDKILYHEDSNFKDKKTKIINIPIANRFSNADFGGLYPIENFYAKRIKWISAFSKFSYQYSEICDYSITFDNINQFIYNIKNLDIWERDSFSKDYETLIFIETVINENNPINLEKLLRERESIFNYLSCEEIISHNNIFEFLITPFWRKLSNYLYIHEETWRESYLPIYLLSK